MEKSPTKIFFLKFVAAFKIVASVSLESLGAPALCNNYYYAFIRGGSRVYPAYPWIQSTYLAKINKKLIVVTIIQLGKGK